MCPENDHPDGARDLSAEASTTRESEGAGEVWPGVGIGVFGRARRPRDSQCRLGNDLGSLSLGKEERRASGERPGHAEGGTPGPGVLLLLGSDQVGFRKALFSSLVQQMFLYQPAPPSRLSC